MQEKAAARPAADTLTLAYVDAASGDVEDTRSDTGLCGVIDSSGDTARKIEYATQYIDTEIEGRLAQAEAEINAQSARLDAKIAQVQAVAERIVPPAVGSVRFSASQSVGPEWLLCDGSFVSESDYPELVAALGKLIPSGDRFQLLSSGEIGPQISNGVLYGGRLWVYSYAAGKLYGVDVEGAEPIREISLHSDDTYFHDFAAPSRARPLALSIVPSLSGGADKLFLAQIVKDRNLGFSYQNPGPTRTEWKDALLLYEGDFPPEGDTLSMQRAFDAIDNMGDTTQSSASLDAAMAVPYVVSLMRSGKETYYCSMGTIVLNDVKYGSLYWEKDGRSAHITLVSLSRTSAGFDTRQRFAYSHKSQKEMVVARVSGSVSEIKSGPTGSFNRESVYSRGTINAAIGTSNPLNIAGQTKMLSAFDTKAIPWLSVVDDTVGIAKPKVALPSAARIFVDAGAYLWGKDIYMIFVGTGLLFSRTLADNDWGYLDTTSVLGTITQFGYLDYSADEGTLYIVGQDTTNRVKAAKIVLNTLYDYANDGAWLPSVASDGVPAYIKAKEPEAEA